MAQTGNLLYVTWDSVISWDIPRDVFESIPALFALIKEQKYCNNKLSRFMYKKVNQHSKFTSAGAEGYASSIKILSN